MFHMLSCLPTRIMSAINCASTDMSLDDLLDALQAKLNPHGDIRFIRGEFSSSQLDDLERRLLCLMSYIKSLRNAFLPIHDLPRETLALIFELLSDMPPPSFLPDLEALAEPYAWLRVTQVCRYWRCTALAFPVLWSTIDGSHPTAARACLERSAQAPLRVYLHDKLYWSHAKPTLEECALVPTLAKHSARFEEFCLDPLFKYRASLVDRFCSPAPHLRVLTIGDVADLGQDKLPPLFGGHTPKLERLVLAGFTSWPGNNFANLKELCLYDQAKHARPQMASLLDLLDACPHLENLVLISAGPDAVDDLPLPVEAPRRLVALPALRALDIGNWVSAPVVARFLSHLVLPPRTHLHVWSDKLLRDAETFGALLPEDLALLGPLQRLTTICITDSTAQKQKHGPQVLVARDGALHVRGRYETSDAPLALFARLDTRRVRALVLAAECRPEWPRARWKTVLQEMPLLTRLTVARRESRQILSALSLHNEPPDAELLCPSLAALTISYDRALSSIHLFLVAEERAQRWCPLVKLRVHGGGIPYSQRLDDELMEMGRYVREVTYDHAGGDLEDIGPICWPSEAYQWTVKRAARRTR